MATVNIAKALKLKNSLVSEINRAKAVLTRENSRNERSTSKVDRAQVYSNIVNKTNELVNLKAQIANANVGLYATLAQMSEAKSMISYLQTLPTTDGVQLEQMGRYGAEKPVETKHDAFFTQEKVDAEVAVLQARIEAYQDVVDTFNATTTIAV
jgi:chromosome segregation ATPase